MNADMLSFLPDHVIFHILSFLPFQDVGRTSVLSKRWRYLWRQTGRIQFHEDWVVRKEELSGQRTMTRDDFIKLIRNWMNNSEEETMVETFILSLTYPEEFPSEMEDCLRFLTLRGVKHLYLDFSDPLWDKEEFDPHLELPTFLYKHTIIESLKLFSCRFNFSEFQNFNVLKDLSLGWVEVTSTSLNSLLIDCPLLESLSLKKCWSLRNPDISGSNNLKLKRLIMDNCNIYGRIKLMVKNLQYFKYSGLLTYFSLEDQPRVKEVEFDIQAESDFDGTGFFSRTLKNILLNLNPTTLTVCSVVLQELPTGEEPLRLKPCLKYLRHLILKTWVDSNELWGIAFMLKACPGLERLTIDLDGPATIFYDYEPPFLFGDFLFWSVHTPFIECVRENLKVVEVNGFKGEHNEIQLLQNLIRYGRVIEVTRVNVHKRYYDSEALYQWWTEMFRNFSKASPSLRIVIS